jgi:hypothetical protein
MLDHLARAKVLRHRAAACEQSAQKTDSVGFGNCYRLLAQNYVILAGLEEDYAHRQVSAKIENNFLAAR